MDSRAASFDQLDIPADPVPLATQTLPRHTLARPKSLAIQATVKVQNDELRIDGRLHNAAGSSTAVFAIPADRGPYIFPGYIKVYDRQGQEITATPQWHTDRPGPWSSKQIGDDGLDFNFRLDPNDHFLPPEERLRIEFWMMTKNGLEKLLIADGVGPLDARALPEWGSAVRRCRLRCRARQKTHLRRTN